MLPMATSLYICNECFLRATYSSQNDVFEQKGDQNLSRLSYPLRLTLVERDTTLILMEGFLFVNLPPLNLSDFVRQIVKPNIPNSGLNFRISVNKFLSDPYLTLGDQSAP